MRAFSGIKFKMTTGNYSENLDLQFCKMQSLLFMLVDWGYAALQLKEF